MIQHSVAEGSVSLRVRVVPRSSKSEIVGEHNGALKVKLNAAPVGGAANEELRKLLAKEFDISVSAVETTAGHTSKSKTVRLAAVDADKIAAILQLKS